MVACRYGISLLVFNPTSHSWAIELNTRRGIPYLRAPMYYSLYNPLLTPAIVVIRSKLVVNYISAIFLNIFLSFFFFFFISCGLNQNKSNWSQKRRFWLRSLVHHISSNQFTRYVTVLLAHAVAPRHQLDLLSSSGEVCPNKLYDTWKLEPFLSSGHVIRLPIKRPAIELKLLWIITRQSLGQIEKFTFFLTVVHIPIWAEK